MHLLAAQTGLISDGSDPVDLDQTPADIVFLSAADTELAALAAANAADGGHPDFLRLAHLSWLSHPYSVDLYISKTAQNAKLVIVRALGGLSYWQYALEQLASRLAERGVEFVALPGDHHPDKELFDISTVSRADWECLLGYFTEGGPDNAERCLSFCRHLICGLPRPPPPSPLMRAGYYWPGVSSPALSDLQSQWIEGAPVAAVVFYRAMLQGGTPDPIIALVRALNEQGINPMPLYATSLKDPVSAATIEKAFSDVRPDIVLNATSFASGQSGISSSKWKSTLLDSPGRPVLQILLATCNEASWAEMPNGLPPRDIAMNVALPELDGRILSRAVAFKSETRRDEATQYPVAGYREKPDRIAFVSELAGNWLKLGRTSVPQRRVGIVLANYPNKDGRLANGVGLDTPASCVRIMSALADAGYSIRNRPITSEELMDSITRGPTNWLADRSDRYGGVRLPIACYHEHYNGLPREIRDKVEGQWGLPEDDPFVGTDGFALSILEFGNVVIGIQPARGYNIDPEETYHSPDLVPPHNYFAFYFWLRFQFGVHAIAHVGKHGNLEWLPGKAVGLSRTCFPEAALGPLPHIYPFIVNDPGEGTQAKRRSQAVIIDHLTPPLTRAESYGPLRDLEVLIDEYHEAAGVDPRRIELLREKIFSAMSSSKLDDDAGIAQNDDADSRLRKLDAYLCELKESQIKDGLHVFGSAPSGRLERDLIAALARLPRGSGKDGNASLTRALAADLELGDDFDPLDCDMAQSWQGARPSTLVSSCNDAWRTAGDTVERLENLACNLIDGGVPAPGPASQFVLDEIQTRIRPIVRNCGPSEMDSFLLALDGRFVPPGPSGAPTRGRIDVLPTGRNFYSVDSRSLPTRTAWELGWKSASLVIERYVQDHGDWPRRIAVTAWGTSNMRTGGDDIAQVMALMGTRPIWDDASSRVTGFEIIPHSTIGRPRVDVTLRISGFFRDAFPAQIDLVSSAAKAVMELEEPEKVNPAAASFRADSIRIGAKRAGFRVFGSKPGAYGAGLQAMIDEKLWQDRGELGEVYIDWGGYAYGSGADGENARTTFSSRLSAIDAVVQNQDNREHDILDSDDYYQFEGGMAAAVEKLKGVRPVIFHNDHSRPERPAIRTLEDEMGRVVRARAVNPKWINGMKRHGYKGAFELAATVDYMFAFAATTGAARSHHFDLVYSAYLDDADTREFVANNNPAALREMAERFLEAIDRGLWQPRRNSTRSELAALANRKYVSELEGISDGT